MLFHNLFTQFSDYDAQLLYDIVCFNKYPTNIVVDPKFWQILL